VSRALAAIVVLALAAAFSLAPGIGAIGGDGTAAAADCAWQRHSKRAIKHVRRDGRMRRVVRIKRWWSCDPIIAPPAITIPPVTLPGPTPQPGPEPEPPPRRVSVKADDATPEHFSFGLSRPFVVAGDVTVELNNQGQDPHNLNLRLAGSADPPLEVGEAGPKESRVAHFGLSPGTYQLWCSLPQHEEWGMSVELEVRSG
jgi:hypothetical protein